MSTIDQRAAAALERIKSGLTAMRIPADPTDPDLVITDLLAELHEANAALIELRALLFGKTGKPGLRDAPWEREAWRIIDEALSE